MNKHLSIPEYWSGRAHAYDQAQKTGERATIEAQLWHEAFEPLHPHNHDNRPLRVLDVGCGSGYISRIMMNMGHDVTGMDSAPGMLEEAVGINTVLADATEPPKEIGHFDAVVSRYVLWTLPDPVAALRAWKGAIKETGGIIACADANWFPRGEGLNVEVDSEDGSDAFIDTYGHGVAEHLPLATVTGVEPYIDAFHQAGLEAQIQHLPKIDELDYACGVSRGHSPRKRFLIWAKVEPRS